MTIGVIGNSHIGMLAAGSHAKVLPDEELVFFGKPGLNMNDIEIVNRKIVARSDALMSTLKSLRMPECIDLGQFDALAIVGSTASVFDVASVLSNHRVFGWPGTQRAFRKKNLSGLRSAQLISPAALQSCLVETTRTKTTFQLAGLLREISAVPIVIVPQPFPSARVLDAEGEFRILKRIARQGEGAMVAEALKRSYDVAFEEFFSIKVLHQNHQTVTRGHLTSLEYSRSPARVHGNATHSKEDVLHANGAFGQLTLQRLFEVLKPTG